MKQMFQTISKLSFLLLIAFHFNAAHAQVDTSLASSLLKGNLQTFLINQLSGKLGTITVSERFNLSNGTIELGSRKVSSIRGTFDQITIKITEKTGTQVFSLVQDASGKLSELQGGQLVSLRSASPANCITQLFGAASACTNCKNKILNCINTNNTFLKRVRCVFSNFDGSCISCGISLAAVVSCLKNN